MLACVVLTFWPSVQRVGTVVSNAMKMGQIADDASKRLPPLAFLGKELEKTAIKLMALSNLNRTVHLPIYNKLIGEAALELKAETA